MSGATAQHVLGVAILPLYLLATVTIGWVAKRRLRGANDFLNASRSLPVWVVAPAFLAANCGALEMIGLSAMAAQYGVQAFQFYWIGAIPAMVFLGLFMLPVYMRSGVRSIPEYLERRFDGRVRLINAWLILVMGTALAGIGLYAMGQVMHVVFGWNFTAGALIAACVVLTYVLLGGLRATIYNEVFQMVVIVGGLLPLLFRSRSAWAHLSALQGTQGHLWLAMPFAARSARVDQFGVIAGLGLVLSFGYWCTDFVLMQRALTTRTIEGGRLVPVLAGFGKLGFSMMVVVPALGAATTLGARMPAAFDQTLPVLMVALYGPVLLGLGTTAIMASLMSSLASNVSAFSSVWTGEIYRGRLRPHASEQHYILIGRVSVVVAAVLSLAASYVAFSFGNLMEYVQLILSLFSAPIFGVFVLGMFTRRATARGAVGGLVGGVVVAMVHHGLVLSGRVTYGSLMSANFYVAVFGFLITVGVGLLMSRETERKKAGELEGLVYQGGVPKASRRWWVMAGLLLGACAALNYIWR